MTRLLLSAPSLNFFTMPFIAKRRGWLLGCFFSLSSSTKKKNEPETKLTQENCVLGPQSRRQVGFSVRKVLDRPELEVKKTQNRITRMYITSSSHVHRERDKNSLETHAVPTTPFLSTVGFYAFSFLLFLLPLLLCL